MTHAATGRQVVRKLTANAILLGASVLVTLLLIETGLRLYYRVPLLRMENFIWERADFLNSNPHNIYDEKLGWRGTPNIRETWHIDGVIVHYTVDAYGDRLSAPGPTDRPVPQRGTLAVGDSFTLGAEVTDEQTWPALLEKMIGGPVVNASTGAWGTDQILVRAGQMIDAADPKTVIVGYIPHDVVRSEHAIMFGVQKPYYTVEAGKPVLHNVPVPRPAKISDKIGVVRTVLGYSYFVYWGARRLGFDDRLQGWEALRSVPDGVGTQITCLLMQELKERLDRAGIAAVFVMEYAYDDLAAPKQSRAIAVVDCAGRARFAVVDTWDAFAAIYASEKMHFDSLWVYHPKEGTFGHMSGDGNRLVAAAIAARLRETGNGTTRPP